jgi:hypothetical protein
MNARDFPQRREKYLRLPMSYQFGNLATDLNRVVMGLSGTGYENIAFWVEQAKHLAEWTAVSAKPEIAKEVLEIHLALATFEKNINDEGEREKMKVNAKLWSDRMIEHSGLLVEDRKPLKEI